MTSLKNFYLQNFPFHKTEIAYHYTNANPKPILEQGFVSKRGIGQTYKNRLGFLYDKNIPFENMLFVSSNPNEFSRDGRYCFTLDISGLEKYADYNHLCDFGVYYNDDDGMLWLNKEDMWNNNQDLIDFFDDHDGRIDVSEFSGDLSMELINSCVVNGDLIDRKRIISVE